MKKLFGLFLSVLVLAGILSPAIPVSATPSNPISIQLVTAKAFVNIFTTGDMLFVASYNIHYTTAHTALATNNFFFNLLSNDGSTLYVSRALTGYEYDMTSIYISPSEVASLGLVVSTEYKLRVTGNPALFPSLTEGVNMATQTLDGWQLDGALTSKQLLGYTNSLNVSHIIDLATTIQTQWTTTLLITNTDGTKILNAAGRTMVVTAIPGIDQILTNIFQSSNGAVSIDPVTSNATLQGNSTMAIRLGPDISTSFTGIGNWLGISQSMAGGLWALLFILTIASIAFLDSGSGIGALICAVPIVISLTYVGAIPFALTFTIIILLIAYTGYFIILRGI